MSKSVKNEDGGMSAYIGVSAPETPRYLLANNFLSEFFISDSQAEERFNYEQFSRAKLLVCEETDDMTKKKLEKSFNRFFDRFSGADSIISRYKTEQFYFPLTARMLKSSNANLRHLLFNLLFAKGNLSGFEEIQRKLKEYLFNNPMGVSSIMSELCEAKEEQARIREKSSVSSGDPFPILRTQGFFRELGKQLSDDLNILLTHPYFTELDFYKKYDSLAILLTSYVVQFIVRRGKKAPFILCKGSSTDSRLNDGGFHKACLANYNSIRNVFSELTKEFYLKRLAEEDKIKIENKDGGIWVEQERFKEYVNRVFDSNFRNEKKLENLAEQIFGVRPEGRAREFTKQEFVMYFIKITNSMSGSSLSRISSTLPSSGGGMGMIFPSSHTRYKYFAMSHELAAFYVRFYLAKIDADYAYLQDFISCLERDYGIYIVKSEKMEKGIRNYHINISRQEFMQNETAFLDTLRNNNCLIKLSDSGHVITLPEKRGEFKLL